MVGNNPTPRPGPDGPLVTWVFERIIPQAHRFLSVDDRGALTAGLDRLAVLVAELISEHTADLASQLATAEGFIEQLECERRAVQGGGCDA